jgi:hypothetical protein
MLEVVPGYEEGDRVEVREVLGGFELGTDDAVVVAGASALTDGAKVDITWESAGGPASLDGEPAAVEAAGSSSP